MTTSDVDLNEQIPMRHADSGPIGWTTRAAFDVLWREKGWVEVSAVDVDGNAGLPGEASADMTVAELRALARVRGTDVPPGASKGDLVALLT